MYIFKANPTNKPKNHQQKVYLTKLLGRFGISLDKPITEVVTQSRFDRISMSYKIKDYKIIEDNKIMVFTQKN